MFVKKNEFIFKNILQVYYIYHTWTVNKKFKQTVQMPGGIKKKMRPM